jgi:hypothetical protein
MPWVFRGEVSSSWSGRRRRAIRGGFGPLGLNLIGTVGIGTYSPPRLINYLFVSDKGV